MNNLQQPQNKILLIGEANEQTTAIRASIEVTGHTVVHAGTIKAAEIALEQCAFALIVVDCDTSESVVESVSDYLDSYIEEAIPTKTIEEATANKRAYGLLSDIRKMLSVDMVLANDSIREAVKDGKETIDAKSKELNELTESHNVVSEELEGLKKDLYLEKKLVGLDDKKTNFVRRTFKDKDLTFIEENFEYTVNIFDKKAQESLDILKEEAMTENKTKEAKVVQEKVETPTTNVGYYAQELANMRL